MGIDKSGEGNNIGEDQSPRRRTFPVDRDFSSAFIGGPSLISRQQIAELYGNREENNPEIARRLEAFKMKRAAGTAQDKVQGES